MKEITFKCKVNTSDFDSKHFAFQKIDDRVDIIFRECYFPDEGESRLLIRSVDLDEGDIKQLIRFLKQCKKEMKQRESEDFDPITDKNFRDRYGV